MNELVIFTLWGFLVGATTMMMVNSHRRTELIKQLKKVAEKPCDGDKWLDGYNFGISYSIDQIERWL